MKMYLKIPLIILVLLFHPGSSEVNMKKCGITRKKSGNIVGGEKAAQGEFPWIVSLQRPKNEELVHFCGASIINERWVLTAAHCFQGASYSYKKMKVVTGALQWKSAEASKYGIEKFISHENYDPDVYANDITLIKTSEPIKIVETKTHYLVNSVCLATPGTKAPDKGTVYGWGYLKEEGEPSPDLMKAEVIKSDTKKCNSVYKDFVGDFTPQMICYGYPKGGRDACKGDSGGPMTQAIKRKGTQIGIISFGLGCAKPDTPGIYQEVAQYYDWIEKTIKANS